MVQIEIHDGPDSGKTYELAPGHHSVGRAATNDVVVAANSVSGKHLQLSVSADGTVTFQDLGSTNGTFSGGLQVAEGEWFSGSELKLGDISLKLVDDSADHQRLREEALEKPRSSSLMKALMALIVIGGGGFAYLQLFTSPEQEVRVVDGIRQPSAATEVSFDLIDNLGDFADAEDWQLSDGASISNGKLSAASSNASAGLTRIVDIDFTAIEIKANAQGDVYLDIAWGVEANKDRPLAVWRSQRLSSTAVMALPPLADWVKVKVQLSAGSSVSDLSVESNSTVAKSHELQMSKAFYDGGNLAIVADNALAFSLSSDSGNWQLNDDGAQLADSAAGSVAMSFGPSYLDDSTESRLQVFADGGPIVPSATMTIDNPAGLICGTKVNSYYFNFDGASNVIGNLSSLRINGSPKLSFLWNLQKPLTHAAMEMQAIEDALDSNDDKELLSSCQTLLRYYPLSEKHVLRARELIGATMTRGRDELNDLQQQASGALFVGAAEVMLELNEIATKLSARFTGTEIAVQADSLSQLLVDVVGQSSDEIKQSRLDYHNRVAVALESVYPNISAWLKEVK
jgi:pSer/pThr/pTyr-binding forkhead associated (FHA) protein